MKNESINVLCGLSDYLGELEVLLLSSIKRLYI